MKVDSYLDVSLFVCVASMGLKCSDEGDKFCQDFPSSAIQSSWQYLLRMRAMYQAVNDPNKALVSTRWCRGIALNVLYCRIPYVIAVAESNKI